MTTGEDLFKYLKNSIDQEYSGYLDTTKANRLFRETVIEVIEQKYRGIEDQKHDDELSNLILLDQEITVRGNRVRTVPLSISDLVFVGTTATITFNVPHQLVTGDSFTIANTQGFTPAMNGQFTVGAVISDLVFQFTIPVTTGAWVVNTGQVTHAFMYPDMMHPLTMKSTFVDSNRNSISSVNISSGQVRLSAASNIRTGSKVRITNGLGVTGLNADHYAKVQSRLGDKMYLFQDSALMIPSVLSGAYEGGAAVRLIVDEYMTKLFPDRRIAPSSQGDVWTPKYGTDDNGFNIYPLNEICTNLTADYIRNPTVTIDTTDNAIDLELYYPFKLLMHIKDRASTTWMLRMREQEVAVVQNQQDQSNI